MNNRFSIERTPKESDSSYRGSILKILGRGDRRVRAINEQESYALRWETHKERPVASDSDQERLRNVRCDILESFDIPYDDEHVYIQKDPPTGTNRRIRSFYILINIRKDEGFYGDGRSHAHNELLMRLIEKANTQGHEINLDALGDLIDDPDPEWMTFKGFLDEDGFEEFSSEARKTLEASLKDEDGNIIEPPSQWFITGHSIKQDG